MCMLGLKIKGIKLILYFFLGLLFLIVIGLFYEEMEREEIESPEYGADQLSPDVLMYEDYVTEELKKYDMEEYKDVVLAIMQVESGGRLRDVMQSSESIGLPVNTIQDPLESIQVGVKHFYNSYQRGQEHGVDIETVIQSYNYGTGFVDYVAKNGKEYSFEVAESFAKEYSGGKKVNYSNPVAIEKNGGWRYGYGNMFYVTLVKQYLVENDEGSKGNEGVAIAKETYEKILEESSKFKGFPYTWGGMHPSTSFDCSGFTMWVYGKAGINLPRTSYEQYKATKRIDKKDLKKGDLIFFKTADYNPVTHVGIYVGDNKMYDSNNSGIGYSDLEGYWESKIVGYGRVK